MKINSMLNCHGNVYSQYIFFLGVVDLKYFTSQRFLTVQNPNSLQSQKIGIKQKKNPSVSLRWWSNVRTGNPTCFGWRPALVIVPVPDKEGGTAVFLLDLNVTLGVSLSLWKGQHRKACSVPHLSRSCLLWVWLSLY